MRTEGIVDCFIVCISWARESMILKPHLYPTLLLSVFQLRWNSIPPMADCYLYEFSLHLKMHLDFPLTGKLRPMPSKNFDEGGNKHCCQEKFYCELSYLSSVVLIHHHPLLKTLIWTFSMMINTELICLFSALLVLVFNRQLEWSPLQNNCSIILYKSIAEP